MRPTPGYLDGWGGCERAGQPKGRGPIYVVSSLALMGYDLGERGTHRMTLEALHPGVTVAQVVENTGFELIVCGEIPTLDPPTEQELRLLQDEMDPQRLYF